MKISKFSVKRPVTVVMAVLIVAILGAISLISLTTSLFPSMNLPYAIVMTSYKGASPERVELMVTKLIENTMATVSNIESIKSVSKEERSTVILEFSSKANMDSVIIDMREKLDMISGYLPEGVGNPMIMKINPDMMPILNFSISASDMDISEATYWIDDKILPRIERIEGVATLSMSGGAKNEVHVTLDNDEIKKINDELNEDIMQFTQMMQSQSLVSVPNKMGIMPEVKAQTFINQQMIMGILQGQNFSMPSGYIEDKDSVYLVRVGDKLGELEDVKNLVLFKNDNRTIKLIDVANVEMVDTADKSYSKVNGERAISITVQKQNSFATSEVVEKVHDEFEKIRKDHPNLEIVALMDQAEYINLAVGSVTKNLIYGGILAIIILFIFLRDIKPTFVVGVAIPISLLAAFILIYFLDITLNVVSLGGLALGIGMLVDNSIVVIENIYRIKSKGKSAKYAAIKGARQVAGAITASTLTTISVFLPIAFIQGMTADIFKEMAWTISASLIASLVIALTFVPMAASQMLENSRVKNDSRLLLVVKKGYGKILRGALRRKTIIIVLTILLFGLSIYWTLQMGTEYFPEADSGQITIDVNLPKGASYEEIAAELDRATEIIMNIDVVDIVGASIGNNMIYFGGNSNNSDANISVTLKKDGLTTLEVEQKIRDELSKLDAEFEVSSQTMDMTALVGSGISVEVSGLEFDELETLTNKVASIIQSIGGTTEVDSGISKTTPVLKIIVDKEKAIENGLTTAQIYMAVDNTINPKSIPAKLTIASHDYDMMVVDKKTANMGIEGLKEINIDIQMGGSIMLSDVADIKIESGFATINRINQERTITVSAALMEGYNIGLVSRTVQDELDKLSVPDGYGLKMTGETEEINKALKDLIIAVSMAVALIYMIMAAQFESLKYPFIVMFAIPLAFTGGFLGLIITSTPLSVVAFIGLIILAGIVVNNGIVLVDYINQLKQRGMDTTNAIIKAGKTRFRPIIMTALTTIFALSTLSIGIGRGAEMMQPLAITAIGGLIFSTALTLIVVPVMYALFDSGRRDNQNNVNEDIDEMVDREGI